MIKTDPAANRQILQYIYILLVLKDDFVCYQHLKYTKYHCSFSKEVVIGEVVMVLGSLSLNNDKAFKDKNELFWLFVYGTRPSY